MKFKPANSRGAVLVELGPEEQQLPMQELRRTAAGAPTFVLKKILVPVDFSQPSHKAFQYAVAFARQFKAELNLLHVVRVYPLVAEMAPVDVESVEDARRDLEALHAQIGELVECRTFIRTGEPQAEIIAVEKEYGIDLIILGTQARSGLARLVLGGTAEKVIRRATCPVLVVREHEHEFLSREAFELSKSQAWTEPELKT